MKNYLAIKLHDDGDFSNTDDEMDLNLECEIHYRLGSFDSNDIGLNVSHVYTPISGDKFFFLPGVTVPRVKMKDLHKDFNVRSVRDIDEANIIFTGSKTIDTFVDYNWEHRTETVKFKEFIETAKEKGLIADYYYDKLATALEFYTEDIVIIDSSARRLLHDDDISFHVTESNYYGSDKFMFISPDYAEMYNHLKDKQLYLEDSLYEYINGVDAVTIDSHMYGILQEMFRSSDTDNHVLAMEIMANSDYKSSILYLCYLLSDNDYNIENRRERTHVNFKSLLTYMGRTTSNVRLDKDDMVELMLRKKLLTKEYFFDMCNKFSSDLEHKSSTHFQVKTVTSSDKINEYFNEELVHKVKSDYTPVITQTNEFTNTELDLI